MKCNLGRGYVENSIAVPTEQAPLAAGPLSNGEGTVVRELSFSLNLQINLITQRFDPRASAIQNINITEVKLTEPDPRLFELPAGYRIANAHPG